MTPAYSRPPLLHSRARQPRLPEAAAALVRTRISPAPEAHVRTVRADFHLSQQRSPATQ